MEDSARRRNRIVLLIFSLMQSYSQSLLSKLVLNSFLLLSFFAFTSFAASSPKSAERTTAGVVDVRTETKKATSYYHQWQHMLLHDVPHDKHDLYFQANHQQAFLTQWKLHKLNRALSKVQSDHLRFTPITFPEEPFIS